MTIPTPRPNKGYLITATDTGAGKSLVSAALLSRARLAGVSAIGYKPVAAGCESHGANAHCNEDVELLLRYGAPEMRADDVCPAIFQAACAPHIAADLEGRSISPAALIAHGQTLSAQCDALIVEGVGGFLVPLSLEPYCDTADLFAHLHTALQLPLVLVVGLRLGCINHAALTMEAIRARGLPLAGWVANAVDADMPYLHQNIETLSKIIAAPCWARIPHLASMNLAMRVKSASALLPEDLF